MGKKGPANFAKRGIHRVEVQTSLNAHEKKVVADICGARLHFSKAAERTFDSVCEIYNARGFRSCEANELCFLSEGKCTLSWTDQNGNGDWVAASFIVDTSVGPWRVVVSRGKVINGTFPVVGTITRIHGADSLRLAKSTPCEWTSRERQAQIKRLRQLRDALVATREELGRFLDSDCSKSRRCCVWDVCQDLQEKCAKENPSLSGALWWQDHESWNAWASRVFKAIKTACNVQECVVPVREINFTHASISTKFLHGNASGADLETLVEDLRSGRIDPLNHRDLVLEAVWFGSRLHSLNNRRLWALQQYQLLRFSEAGEVRVRVKVLPWSESATIKRFVKTFDSQTAGETVSCRTKLPRAPLDGVVATTLGRGVLSTKASLEAERYRELSASGHTGGGQTHANSSSVEGDAGTGQCSGLSLGNESFANLNDAKVRVQKIMRTHSGGQPVPEQDLQLLLELLKFHPAQAKKRIGDVVKVTVGSSEKFAGTPAFWIWRSDGSGEDISANKCWKRMDLATKYSFKKTEDRDTIADGQRCLGRLDRWVVEDGKCKKSFGYVKFLRLETESESSLLTIYGSAEKAMEAQTMILQGFSQHSTHASETSDPLRVNVSVDNGFCYQGMDLPKKTVNIPDLNIRPRRQGGIHSHFEERVCNIAGVVRAILQVANEVQAQATSGSVTSHEDIQNRMRISISLPRRFRDFFMDEERIVSIERKSSCSVSVRSENYGLTAGQTMYLAWADVSVGSQAKVQVSSNTSSAREPFKPGSIFSFKAYRWRDHRRKLGCEDARLLEGADMPADLVG
eukprot:TRINITY_DN14226_c2_g1_i1.p1 TRINITY_DN14226_c2_g1~~TRINITY_DN14226_c2_g1_i1.p1  ORF type:complete len:809 (-),score=59.60 TRINITY_DN14226_c2_g1_i1:101-2497(-)